MREMAGCMEVRAGCMAKGDCRHKALREPGWVNTMGAWEYWVHGSMGEMVHGETCTPGAWVGCLAGAGSWGAGQPLPELGSILGLGRGSLGAAGLTRCATAPTSGQQLPRCK